MELYPLVIIKDESKGVLRRMTRGRKFYQDDGRLNKKYGIYQIIFYIRNIISSFTVLSP